MIEAQTTLVNLRGLHARAASKLVNTASSFGCKITIVKNGKQADGKSIMAIMMLAAANGCELTISTDGQDEQAAMDALLSLIANRFDEEE